MKPYKVGRSIFLSAIGFVIMGAGLALIKLLPKTDGILKTLPYLCVGIGAGIFGGNLGTAIKNKAVLQNPQVAKQIEIEQKDERNQAIRNKAKARAYDLMIYVYAAILSQQISQRNVIHSIRTAGVSRLLVVLFFPIP